MAVVAPGKEVSKELARELLIEISNTLPDKPQKVDDIQLPEKFYKPNGFPEADDDAAEKYRSNLISISYTQLPDANMSPVALVEP